MRKALLLTFITFSFYGFSQKSALTPKVKFEKNTYIIEYPKSWRPDTSKIMGTDLFLFSPLENENDKFSENINILIQDLGEQNITLEQYKKLTDNQL
jgi:hypothetical protein